MKSPTAVILGASNDRGKFGNKAVRAHLQAGYDVFPVNPKSAEIAGQKAYASLAALPEQPFGRVSVYVPPSVGVKLLDEIAALDVREVWINPGSESPELLARAEALGLPVVQGCSIVSLGLSPSQFPG